MTRVEINADGRAVTVDHDAPLDQVADAALALWRQTETPHRTGAGSAGFQAERSFQCDRDV